MYGTRTGLPVTSGEIHRRHRRQQRGNWWSTVPSQDISERIVTYFSKIMCKGESV